MRVQLQFVQIAPQTYNRLVESKVLQQAKAYSSSAKQAEELVEFLNNNPYHLAVDSRASLCHIRDVLRDSERMLHLVVAAYDQNIKQNKRGVRTPAIFLIFCDLRIQYENISVEKIYLKLLDELERRKITSETISLQLAYLWDNDCDYSRANQRVTDWLNHPRFPAARAWQKQRFHKLRSSCDRSTRRYIKRMAAELREQENACRKYAEAAETLIVFLMSRPNKELFVSAG